MTQQPPILISTRDLARLEQLLETQPAAACAGLEALEAELSRAEIVSPEQMPADVVTMNATVCFQLAGASQPFTLTLVYPDEMDNSQDRLSILAPVGSALLGLRKGDTIRWPGPGGKPLDVTIVDILPEREAPKQANT